jgi:hypothetical protein
MQRSTVAACGAPGVDDDDPSNFPFTNAPQVQIASKIGN